MTREERRIRRENKRAMKENDRLAKKLFKQEERQWNDFLKRMNKKNALITEN